MIHHLTILQRPFLLQSEKHPPFVFPRNAQKNAILLESDSASSCSSLHKDQVVNFMKVWAKCCVLIAFNEQHSSHKTFIFVIFHPPHPPSPLLSSHPPCWLCLWKVLQAVSSCKVVWCWHSQLQELLQEAVYFWHQWVCFLIRCEGSWQMLISVKLGCRVSDSISIATLHCPKLAPRAATLPLITGEG